MQEVNKHIPAKYVRNVGVLLLQYLSPGTVMFQLSFELEIKSKTKMASGTQRERNRVSVREREREGHGVCVLSLIHISEPTRRA